LPIEEGILSIKGIVTKIFNINYFHQINDKGITINFIEKYGKFQGLKFVSNICKNLNLFSIKLFE